MEILRSVAVADGCCFPVILQVRQVDLDLAFQQPQGFHLFVAAAVKDHRHWQFGLQRFQKQRHKLGGCNQINVVGPLVNERTVDFPQVLRGNLPALALPADFTVLAELALEGAAGEKYCTAAPGTAEARLLPQVEGGSGCLRPQGAAAVAQLSRCSFIFRTVDPAVVGT